MTDLPPLTGEHRRIKWLPCPEGKDAKQGTKIGEIECEHCGHGAKAYVCVGAGSHVYAFHNSHHPAALGTNDQLEKPCGSTIIKTNRPQGAALIRHWTAQRYSKGETARVEETKAPAQARPATDRKPAAPVGVPGARGSTGTGARPATKPGGGTAAAGAAKRSRFFPWS